MHEVVAAGIGNEKSAVFRQMLPDVPQHQAKIHVNAENAKYLSFRRIDRYGSAYNQRVGKRDLPFIPFQIGL